MGFKHYFLIYPVISCKFLFLLNATNELFWNVSRNSWFIWRTFQYLFKTLRIFGSFPLYVIRQGIISLLLFSFSLTKSFWWVLSTFSIRSLKFSLYPFHMNFFPNIAQCFCYCGFIRLLWNRWFWSSTLGYAVCFFKWLCMVWMCREIGLLISGFSVESCLKSVVLVFIWMCQKCVRKYICCVKCCLQIWSLYVCCLNFL